MKVWNQIKTAFTQEGKTKKFLWGLLTIALLVLLLYSVRSCSSGGAKKKIFLIGRESSWYSVELGGKERNLTAFTNDLFSIIAEENKMKFEWYESTPSGLVHGLDIGDYDFILTSLRTTFINQQKYDFSDPIYQFGPVLLVRQDSTVTSLKELKGQTIGLHYGFSWANNAQNVPEINTYDLYFTTYTNMNHALDDLVNDKIDGVIMQAIPAFTLTQGLYAGKIKVVTPPFSDEGIRVVSLKRSKYENIIEEINESIKEMRSNGTYESLVAKWNLIDPSTHFWHPAKEVKE